MEVQGERTLWWNQRMRLQKLHCGFPRHLKSRNHQLSVPSILKGSARQAVCPFCYKAFYDKSTMNRHVAKRVCLGVAFQQASKHSDMKEVPGTEQTNKQDEVQDAETEMLPYTDMSDEVQVHPFSNKTDDVLSFLNKPDDIHTYSDRTDDLISESNKKKSSLEPCPYCKKMLKGTRGIRKHLDFYGCPMYPTSENK